jgi:hypothetical protein
MTEMTTMHAVDHHTAKHNGTWLCRDAGRTGPARRSAACSSRHSLGPVQQVPDYILIIRDERQPYPRLAANEDPFTVWPVW